MAPLALAIVPLSPEGTKAIVMGVSEAPSWPAAGAAGASGNLSQTGGMAVGTAVGAVVAVAGTAVGAVVAAGVVTGIILGYGKGDLSMPPTDYGVKRY